MKKKNYIICADIHGRNFWKKAVAEKKDDEMIIFLGDYLEPYTGYEDITHQDAYENFLEILEYKKAHKDDCILLLGNHDFACIDKTMISCRHDYGNHMRNEKLFKDNIELFQLCHSIKIGDKEFWFSHSGIHKDWFERFFNPNELEDVVWDSEERDNPVKFLNEQFSKNYEEMLYFLSMYSRYRGWSMYEHGSCIWADCREWTSVEDEYEGVYQIFGHTMLDGEPIITGWWANLDCKRAFRLDCETGEILELSGEKVKLRNLESGEYEDE